MITITNIIISSLLIIVISLIFYKRSTITKYSIFKYGIGEKVFVIYNNELCSGEIMSINIGLNIYYNVGLNEYNTTLKKLEEDITNNKDDICKLLKTH